MLFKDETIAACDFNNSHPRYCENSKTLFFQMFDNSHKENIAPPTQENFSHEDIFLFERKHKQKQTEKRQKI